MSYILDALRKSDQQRQQGATPTLASVPLPVQEPRRRRVLWLGALAAVLFIMGIGIGWWLPWQPEMPHPDRAPMHPLAAGAAPRFSDSGETAEPPQRARSQAKEGILVSAAPPVANATQTSPGVQPTAPAVAAEEGRRERAINTTAAPHAPAPAGSATPFGAEAGPSTVESKIMARSDLPAAILQEVPKMTVSLHAYSSNPTSRLVGVNDQLLHEGDSLAPGLVLEQITPADMVFSYKGFRFRQGVR